MFKEEEKKNVAAAGASHLADTSDKLLWGDSTEQEYLKHFIGNEGFEENEKDEAESSRLSGAIKAMDNVNIEENDSILEYLKLANEEQGEASTLPDAIKAMDDIQVDEDASLVQRRYGNSTMERILRLGRKAEVCEGQSKSIPATDGTGVIQECYANDDNNTVDEMIEESEREEETNLNNILDRIPVNSLLKSSSVTSSTKNIRMNLSKTIQDREISPCRHSKRKSLVNTMNNSFSKTRIRNDNDSLAGDETVGKIVTHIMDESESHTVGDEERTLHSWTDFRPIANSISTPIGQSSIENDDNVKNTDVTSTSNKFVSDETSVGSISEEIEVIVSKHRKMLDDEAVAVENLERCEEGGGGGETSIFSTMVSSLSFDATNQYYKRARSLLGLIPASDENEAAKPLDPETEIKGVDAKSKGDNVVELENDWWVEAEKFPTTPIRASYETPSPQNSIGKPKDPGTPSTIVILGYEDERGHYVSRNRRTNICSKWKCFKPFKRASEKYGNFYTFVILGAIGMLFLSIILVIAAFTKLDVSDNGLNEAPPQPPPLIIPPEENINIFDLETVTIEKLPPELQTPSKWSNLTDTPTLSPSGQSMIDNSPTTSTSQLIIEDDDEADTSQFIIPTRPTIPARPTAAPTSAPTRLPTSKPTAAPTSGPTFVPTNVRTTRPTAQPTTKPTIRSAVPTATPSRAPTKDPTNIPTAEPTAGKTDQAPSAGSPDLLEFSAFFEERLRNSLEEYLPESLAKLNDPLSPQSRALEWMKLNPPDIEGLKLKPFVQRYVLGVLFYSTNGEEWFSSSGWMSSSDECDWFATSNSGHMCDELGHVVEIDLRSNNLKGVLPAELSLLSQYITRIRVNGNSLQGPIPPFIGQMTNLQRFHAHWNSLSGTIPANLAMLKNLLSLRLGKNRLSGTIPNQLSDLQYLEALDLGSNDLAGTVPSMLGALSDLAELDLSSNNLFGTIPVDFQRLRSIVRLELDKNNLTGEMPNELCMEKNVPFLEIAKVDCLQVRCSCCDGC